MNISEWGRWYWVVLTYAGFPSIPAMVREGLPCSWPFHFRWCLRTLLTVWTKLGAGCDVGCQGEAGLGGSLWQPSVPAGWGELVSLSILKDWHSFLWGKREGRLWPESLPSCVRQKQPYTRRYLTWWDPQSVTDLWRRSWFTWPSKLPKC